jgi:uncharacterized membrane protein (UPF0182 family)
MKRRSFTKKVALWAGALVAAAVVLAVLAGIAWVWTDYRWFVSVGHESVFWGVDLSQIAVWLAFAIGGFAVIYPSMRAAWLVVSTRHRFPRSTAFVSALLAGALAIAMSQQWMTFRLAIANQPFGVKDLQFHMDVGFFVFVLPALERVYQWLNGLLVIAIVAVVAVVASSRLQLADTVPVRWSRLKRILGSLAGVLTLAVALNFWIQVWRISYSPGGQFFGASYASVTAALPAYWIMFGLSVALALVLFVTAQRRGWKLMTLSLVAWAVAGTLLVGVWPYVIQNYVAAPNEATVEQPYRARNIAMTRAAFDLSSVQGVQYPALQSISASASGQAQRLLEDATIWTPASVSQAFNQLQTIRPYYTLSPVDYDRYDVNGDERQVLVSGREINPSGLPANARTWVNTHLVYTHGYGLALSSTSQTTDQGFPLFFVGDVPSVLDTSVASASALVATQPRIYFGPDMSSYGITNTRIDEFDYPQGETNTTDRYTGTGPPVGSWLSRLAWAVRLRSYQMVFSDYLTPDSQILLFRNVMQRVAKIAPWLTLDTKAYPAIVDGRILWIIDGYTQSDHYPASQPLSNGTNYLRNSVKVTVDAYTGEVKLYANGPDPIRDAWAKIFPGVITPADQMPAGVAAHIRAPQALVAAQAQTYQAYHMTDPTVFYNREDLWQVSVSASGTPIPPMYVMLDLPNASGVRSGKAMYVLQPFTLANRNNLVAWMAVDCDQGAYGTRTVYLLPKDRVVLGQQQVSARINQDPNISQQLTLWNQPGVSVIFGNMLVLPVEDTVAYIQPMFLQAQNNAMSQLVSVIAVNGDRVEFDRTLAGALAKAYGSTPNTGTAPAAGSQ